MPSHPPGSRHAPHCPLFNSAVPNHSYRPDPLQEPEAFDGLMRDIGSESIGSSVRRLAVLRSLPEVSTLVELSASFDVTAEKKSSRYHARE